MNGLTPAMTRGVIPVVTIADAADAVPLALALLSGGLSVIEITLRSDAAIPSIRAIRAEVPEMLIGAGTVLTRRQLDDAERAGAGFIVTPATTPSLLAALLDSSLPVLPGGSTASEVAALRELGYSTMKFFPAEASGGVGFVDAMAGPFADVSFCPTGGISAGTASSYLARPNVFAVGGTWVAPTASIAAAEWSGVERRARHASGLDPTP